MRENPKPLEQVLTFAEATKRWGLGHSTLREAAKHNRFLPGEIRKSGGTWLVTEEAMRRLYGEPKGGVRMKTLKKIITILSDFPAVDEDYVLGSTEDGKYFFSWNWDIEELPDEEILAGESGIKYYDTLEEAAQDMKETIEASEHLLNNEDVQKTLKELNSILA